MAAFAVAALALCAGAARGESVSLTLKGGYFLPTDEVFKDVYKGGPAFGADLAVPIGGVLRVWGGAELFGKTGRLTLTEDETTVRIVPVYLGLRLESGRPGLRPYAGLAAAYFFFSEENVLGSASEGALGFLAQAGLAARLGGAVWLDLFAGYRGCRLKAGGAEPLEARLDGLSAGLGLSFRF